MDRVFKLGLISIGLTVMAACGKGEEAPSPNTTTESQEPTKASDSKATTVTGLKKAPQASFDAKADVAKLQGEWESMGQTIKVAGDKIESRNHSGTLELTSPTTLQIQTENGKYTHNYAVIGDDVYFSGSTAGQDAFKVADKTRFDLSVGSGFSPTTVSYAGPVCKWSKVDRKSGPLTKDIQCGFSEDGTSFTFEAPDPFDRTGEKMRKSTFVVMGDYLLSERFAKSKLTKK